MKRFALAAALGTLALTSCATAPTPQQISAADYGTSIDQDSAEGAAKAWFGSHLKDPYSAVYEWHPIYKGFTNKVPLLGLDAAYGYRMEVGVNAKNSFGGYTGAKQYTLLIRDGSVVRAAIQDCSMGSCMWQPVP